MKEVKDKKAVSLRNRISWKNMLFLLIAGCINAVGVTIFLFPVKLYDSGISGLSMLLDQVSSNKR